MQFAAMAAIASVTFLPSAALAGAATMSKPNLLFMMADQLRADALGTHVRMHFFPSSSLPTTFHVPSTSTYGCFDVAHAFNVIITGAAAANGGKPSTPNLDQLGREGVRFTNAYAHNQKKKLRCNTLYTNTHRERDTSFTHCVFCSSEWQQRNVLVHALTWWSLLPYRCTGTRPRQHAHRLVQPS